jgi:N-acetylglucosamine kinase-like BadF-type ATPase
VVVIGIDAGGTKTVCRLADQDGKVLAEARGAGANLQNTGERHVETVLQQLMTETIQQAGAWPAVVCLGMAGVDRVGDAAVVSGILARLAPTSEVVVVNDALIALEAGVPGGPGVVIIAGTGSIAYGRSRAGRAARAGGWGYLLGDEGSGYWLGRQSLRAVVRSADGRGPHTLLTARVLAHYGVSRPQELVREIYDGRFQPSTVAAIAPAVQLAADDGDEIALHLIDTGARELSLAARSVCDQLALSHGPVVLAGGMFRAVPRMRQRVVAHLTGRWPGMLVTSLTGEPADGAVSLALAAALGTLVLPTYLDR